MAAAAAWRQAAAENNEGDSMRWGMAGIIIITDSRHGGAYNERYETSGRRKQYGEDIGELLSRTWASLACIDELA